MHLYALGSNGAAQLGIGTYTDTAKPKQCLVSSLESAPLELVLPPDELPLKIIAGGDYTLVQCKSGQLYRAGRQAASSGDASRQAIIEPGFEVWNIDTTGAVKLSSSTWAATVVVDTNNVIYACGSGPKGELGLGPGVSESSDLTKVESLSSGPVVVDLASSVSHTVLVTSNGDVYGWGNGRKGQLGEPAEIVWAPRRVQGIDFKVVQVVCGRDFTFLAGEAAEGRYAVLGSSRDAPSLHTAPAPNDIKGWQAIGANWGTIHVLYVDGTIVSWGRNNHGQYAPSGLPQIKSFAVGSEHVLAVTSKGDLLTWGWGEHGNSGEDIDHHGDVNGRHNVIPLHDVLAKRNASSAKICGVGAGCATSFFWASEAADF